MWLVSNLDFHVLIVQPAIAKVVMQGEFVEVSIMFMMTHTRSVIIALVSVYRTRHCLLVIGYSDVIIP